MKTLLLPFFPLLNLISCSEEKEKPTANSPAHSDSTTTPLEHAEDPPPITFDLQKDAIAFQDAFLWHLAQESEGHVEYIELLTAITKLDEASELDEASVKLAREIHKSLPFVCGNLPDEKTFVKRLQEDEFLQIITAAILDQEKTGASREELLIARQHHLDHCVRQYSQQLGPIENPYAKALPQLRAIIESR